MVIKITIDTLIEMLPDLVNFFLSGFVFMSVYLWLNGKKCSTSKITLLSLFVSVIIQSLCSAAHTFILAGVNFSDAIKILIYMVVSVALAVVITLIQNTKFARSALTVIANKTVNSDIFNDVIDCKESTVMRVYLKNSNRCYSGKFMCREENGLDSWIALINYRVVDKDSDETIINPRSLGINSSILLNLRDVESIECIYEDGSKIWDWFSGGKDSEEDQEEYTENHDETE